MKEKKPVITQVLTNPTVKAAIDALQKGDRILLPARSSGSTSGRPIKRGKLNMHTIIVLSIGFGLLGLCVIVGRVVGGTPGIATAALIFLPLWLIGAGINMYIGVKQAGYSVADEAPIFLLVFAVPAVVALAVWWKLR